MAHCGIVLLLVLLRSICCISETASEADVTCDSPARDRSAADCHRSVALSRRNVRHTLLFPKRDGTASLIVNSRSAIAKDSQTGDGMITPLVLSTAGVGRGVRASATAASASVLITKLTLRKSKLRGRRIPEGDTNGIRILGPRALSFLAPALRYPNTRPATQAALRSDRSRCRPTARSAPLRLAVVKPRKTEPLFATKRDVSVPGNKIVDGGGQELRVGCGGNDGGMGASFMWMESVNSTMDEVKTLIVNQEGSSTKEVFAVAAREQLNGRGTKGRAWIGLPGNVFLTVAIPLDRVPVPLSLIPLRVGTLIAPEIQRRLRHRESPDADASDQSRHQASQQEQRQQPQDGSSSYSTSSPSDGSSPASSNRLVSLKWPNDVLLGGGKVAGVLIEAELPFLLVGIGVNVRHKPDVPQQGPDRGRPAACLADFGADCTDQAVRDLSAALTEKLCSWASGKDSADVALAEWSRWVDWSLPLEIRDEGRAVSPVGVAQDGRLRVVDSETGKEELLATEYLL